MTHNAIDQETSQESSADDRSFVGTSQGAPGGTPVRGSRGRTQHRNQRVPVLTWPCAGLIVATGLLVTTVVPEFAGKTDEHGTSLETNIGMEGTYYLRYSGPSLAARPVDEQAAVVLRIADAVNDNGSTIYELRYVGTRPGRYDLRDSLVRIDGQPIAGLDPAVVIVNELLTADHDGSLTELSPLALPVPLRYRLLMWGAGVVWLSTMIWLAVRKFRHRPVNRSVDEAFEPTLADQLRPLVEAAVSGRLSSTEKGRLELLLFSYWRQRLELMNCNPAESFRRMRRHHQAGELLTQLENWLHQRPGTVTVDIPAVLEPYRHSSAIDLTGFKAEEVMA